MKVIPSQGVAMVFNIKAIGTKIRRDDILLDSISHMSYCQYEKHGKIIIMKT